jgi:NAD(P)-dependent dehydrogenase (short-subunit alcohol dehydrogenase family)
MTGAVPRPALPAPPSFDLGGRRALITGGGRGIGLAAAAALAGAGAHVTLCARNADELCAAAAAIADRGQTADTLPLDITDIVSTRAAIEARPAYDILVNNAGMNRPGDFLAATPEDFDAVLGLNLRAAFFAAQSVARRMVACAVRGSIINISSQMGLVGGARRTLYCASKWGVEGLTRAMALDLAAHGIRVNSICPTFTVTEFTRPFLADEAFKGEVLRRIKLGRLGEVGDLTGAVLYLASDASSLATGGSVVVDGGWTAD